MKYLSIIFFLSGAAYAADATTNGTPDATFQAGKDFAASMQSTVEATLNEESAHEHVEYTEAPPQASTYQETPPRSMGVDKKNYCANSDLSTMNERDRKECEAVNYLSGIENRTNPYVLDEANDPLFKRYEEGLLLAEKINADTCSLEGTTIPSDSGITEVCSEAVQRSDKSCQDTLDVKVTRVGRTYQLEFAVTVLLAKSTSNGCEEDAGSGKFKVDFGKFTSYFSGTEYQNNYFWKPTAYVGVHAGTRMWDGRYSPNQRLNVAVEDNPYSELRDNGKICHKSPNMLTGIYIRPIYTNDMIDFLYKEGSTLKPDNTTSFKDVSLFRFVSATTPPGTVVAGPSCGLGEDVPKYNYTMSGKNYYNGPRRCNTNPGKTVNVIDQNNGIVEIGVSKGSPSFTYHYAHNYSTTYIGIGYPLRVKFAAEKSVVTIKDEWVYGCSQFRN